jgi:hypothetical protein
MDDIDGSPNRLLPCWETEDEDDDDDDSIFRVMKMKQISRCTTNCCRKRALAPAADLMRRGKKFGRGTLLWVTEGSKRTTLLQILFSVMSSSVEGKILL